MHADRGEIDRLGMAFSMRLPLARRVLASARVARTPLPFAPPSLLPRAAPPALSHAAAWLSSSSSAAAAEAEQPKIMITERCAERIVSLNRKQGVDDPAAQKRLRLSVEPGGCSGFSYKFEMEESSAGLEEEDIIFEQLGAQVVVDDSSLALLEGATIDFEDEMMKSAFVVSNNPQSGQSCGCGTSFNPI